MKFQRQEHFWVPGEIWTTNAERRMHWAIRGRLVKNLRQSAFIEGKQKGVKFEHLVDIIVEPHQRAKISADADGYHPAIKAVIDGLVDAKVIGDDSPKFVNSIKYLRPQISGVAGIKIWISYLEDDFEA
jgi:hypothetical protein